MKANVLKFARPVTLVGGGARNRAMLDEALALAPEIVAADGAADRVDAMGLRPAAVIGDMDSVADRARWAAEAPHFLHLDEQDTTDFEKCLYATEAPFYVAAGFTGRRVDHMLAVFHTMLARPERTVVLLGEEEAIALMPPGEVLEIALAPGAVVSFFPLLPAVGLVSTGLEWPVTGLELAPGVQSGTSNRASAGTIRAGFDRPGVLILLPRRFLAALVSAICASPAAQVGPAGA